MINKLYQEILLKHNREPYHFGSPPSYCSHGRGYNPTCGDDLTVYLGCDARRCAAVHFSGEACAIATASASLMSGVLDGVARDELADLCRRFIRAVEQGQHLDNEPVLQPVAVLLNVRHFPGRIGCATLPWKALLESLAFSGKSSGFTQLCQCSSEA